ncbi:MAG: fumarylacetoacetate hydrolase family protein [Pseudomonadota bacterium]
MSFRFANIAGRASLIEGDYYYDVAEASGGALEADPMLVVGNSGALEALANTLSDLDATGLVAQADLLAPIPFPLQSFGVGLNYRNHAEESGAEIPVVPLVFTKFASCIARPNVDVQMRSDFVDFEGELVVVIGKPGKDISKEVAWQHVFGLCVGQDYSDRAVQMASQPPQFSLGKSFDTFGPIGPFVTSMKVLDDPYRLQLKTLVNGEVRQSDSTGDLIFDVPTLVSYLSHITPLYAGDVIFTGTPGGVGAAEGKFLKEGDVVTTEIEGLGQIQNRCVRAPDHPHTQEMAQALAKFAAARKS